MLRFQTGRLHLLILTLLVAVAGCNSNPTPVSMEKAQIDESVVTSSQTLEFQAQWEQLINEARQEGKVFIVLGSARSRDHRPIFEAFTKKFGVEVVATTGSGSSNVQRVLAERSRGKYTVDVSMLGSTSGERLVEAGALVPLVPLFIHPEVVDRSQGWLVDDYVWNDTEGAFSAGTHLNIGENIAEIYYNTDNVSWKEIDSVQSVRDFLKPQWRGRIVSILDPDFGGVTSEPTRVWRVLGREWFESFLREAEPTLLPGGSVRELSDGLARGKYHVALFVNGAIWRDLDKMAEIGLPVSRLTRTLAEGPAVEVVGSSAVFDQAPHPKAAQLFVNWYLSRDGQNTRHELTDDVYIGPSLRTDVAQGKVSDADWKLFRTLKTNSIQPEIGSEWAADAKAFVIFTRDICRELGCYGY